MNGYTATGRRQHLKRWSAVGLATLGWLAMSASLAFAQTQYPPTKSTPPGGATDPGGGVAFTGANISVGLVILGILVVLGIGLLLASRHRKVSASK
jgi:LPXTG-motif cell wall-anchored protein